MGVYMLSWIVVLIVLLLAFEYADALSCYMCPRTSGQSVDDANIECLALGWELSCASDQDRCYSASYVSDNQVEKGCTQSQSCVGTTFCCQGDFCNADPQNSQTGYGKRCDVISDCIQGADVMRCERRAASDPYKMCLCTETSYTRGATCKRKSYPDEWCTEDYQCLDVNTTCINQMCVCDSGMYSNNTRCDLQKGLGESCQYSKECRGFNTQCSQMQCTCDYGFLVINGTDSCSGSMSFGERNIFTVMVVEMFGIFFILMRFL